MEAEILNLDEEALWTTTERVSRYFPILHHYTDANGLSGILTTNTLWATHFGFLNDSSEVEESKRRVLRAVLEYAASAFDWWKDDEALAGVLPEMGGFDSALKATITDYVEKVFSNSKTLIPPYIVSFSCPDRPDEIDSGALEMWRAYSGGGSSYALVLETKKLEALMQEEGKLHSYAYMQLQNVTYDPDGDKELVAFAKLATEVLNGILQSTGLEARGTSKAPEQAYLPTMLELTRHKNRHFSAEREVRLVGCPFGDGGQEKIREPRPINHRISGGGFVPTAHFFGKDVSNLPITKIIVGPSSKSQIHSDGLRRYLEQNRLEIAVEISEIPFRLL